MIKAVTIDCWGTLLLDSPLSDERYTAQRLAGIEKLLAASGIAVRTNDLHRAYDAFGRRLARIWADHRDVSVEEHVRMILGALDPELPARLDPALVEEMTVAYAAPALVVPPTVDPGAAGALERLAAEGMTLGVVSNTMRTPGTVLRQILDRSGLLAPFTMLSFSDECGVRKPDPEIFRLTLRQVGVPAAEAVHVGDDAVLDVEGARDAGMGSIQVVANGCANGPVPPDAVIAGLAELPAALARLRR
jgi:putative hydrolase of the HAD superfamily